MRARRQRFGNVFGRILSVSAAGVVIEFTFYQNGSQTVLTGELAPSTLVDLAKLAMGGLRRIRDWRYSLASNIDLQIAELGGNK